MAKSPIKLLIGLIGILVFGAGIVQPASAQITNISVTSAADYSLGVPSVGGIGALFCTGLSVSGIQIATTLPLPTTLAGVQVLIGGAPAPIYAVASVGSYQQVNFEVPQGAEPDLSLQTTVAVTVSQFSQSGSASVPILLSNPGQLFEIPRAKPTDTPAGVFQHDSDYSLITSASPAQSGESVTLYGSGFALLSPLPADGTPATANPFTQSTPTYMPGFGILDVFTVFIDQSTDVVPDFMGLTPGAVGLGQINFVVPPLTSGTHEIQIKQVRHLISPFFMYATYLSKPVLLFVQ